MQPSEMKNSVAGTVIRVAISACLWIALLVMLIALVPAQRREFDAFGIPLPNLTQFVADVSAWFADYWYVTIPFLLPLFVVAAALTWVVRHQVKSRLLDGLWTLVLLGLPFALIAIVWLSLYIPRIKLAEGLAR